MELNAVSKLKTDIILHLSLHFVITSGTFTIVVADGNSRSRLSTVELLGDNTCSIPNLPYAIENSPQMFLNEQNELVICGGYPKKTSCLRLFNGEWKEYAELNKERQFASVVSMDDKTYMFGGWDSETSSEIFQNGSWKEGPTIPGEGIRYGCGVAISKEELLLIGGGYNTMNRNRITKYNIKTKNWTDIDSLKVGRFGHSCTLFKDQVFITGGFDGNTYLNSVEILSLDTMTIKEGNGLQVARYHHGSGLVHLNGKLRFAVFGGFNRNDRNLDSIELFDEDTETWTLSKTKLSERKQEFGFLSVPSHLICP